MDEETSKQKALRSYLDDWNIKAWITLNSHISVSIQDWLGKDPFQEKYGLDKVLIEVINLALENIQNERKHYNKSQSNKSQQLEPSGLQFPKNLRS